MSIDATRREVLKSGGALMVSFSISGAFDQAFAQGAPAKPVALTEVDSFLAIDPKGMVTVYSGKVDLGTGVATALPQIVAEELDVPLTAIRLVQGDTALTPDQGTTWGSLSIHLGGMQLRNAAATAMGWQGDPASSTSAGVGESSCMTDDEARTATGRKAEASAETRATLLEAGAALDARLLQRECQRRLESYMVPKQIVLVASLPRTSTGKVKKTDLS